VQRCIQLKQQLKQHHIQAYIRDVTWHPFLLGRCQHAQAAAGLSAAFEHTRPMFPRLTCICTLLHHCKLCPYHFPCMPTDSITYSTHRLQQCMRPSLGALQLGHAVILLLAAAAAALIAVYCVFVLGCPADGGMWRWIGQMLFTGFTSFRCVWQDTLRS